MKITNNYNVPLSLAVWLAYDEYEYSAEPKTISATSLLKPLQSIVLSTLATESSVPDVSDLVASAMGTSIHTAIETAWKASNLKATLEALGYPKRVCEGLRVNPTPEQLVEGCIPVYMEIRKTKEIEGWNVTGKFDFISDGRIEDFKSTGTYGYINQSNKDKYIQQASIYRWLNQDIVTQDSFVINYIFTDWSAAKAKQETGYPQSRLLPQEYVLMSINDTEQFLKSKLKLVNKYLADPSGIPECTSEELWQKDSVFKYYKNPEKLERSTKNFDSYWEANQKLTEDGSVGIIKEVKGEATFCKYCSARAVCKQAASLIKEGRLIV
jgi:hypothetical protein